MKNKTTVTIYDMDFTLVGDEDESYMHKVAAHVDAKLREVAKSPSLSLVAAAVLTSANIADDYFRALASSDNLRSQLKDYFDEISRLKDENAELRRDLARFDTRHDSSPGWEERQSKIDMDGNK